MNNRAVEALLAQRPAEACACVREAMALAGTARQQALYAGKLARLREPMQP